MADSFERGLNVLVFLPAESGKIVVYHDLQMNTSDKLAKNSAADMVMSSQGLQKQLCL